MDLEKIETVEPFIINKNLGEHLDPEKLTLHHACTVSHTAP